MHANRNKSLKRRCYAKNVQSLYRRLCLQNACTGFLLVCLLVMAGCESQYYGVMEKFGRHKRDILVDRVRDSQDAQQQAKEQFQSALEQFRTVVSTPEGNLDEKYRMLNAELERSQDRAQTVKNRIAKVEDVSKALFDEWKEELNEYSDERLRASSQQKLEMTQRRYEQYMEAMKRAESRLDPVLTVFHDQVLYLKHNLNAQAIGAIQNEMMTVDADVSALVKDMETSIIEADTFIKAMEE